MGLVVMLCISISNSGLRGNAGGNSYNVGAYSSGREQRKSVVGQLPAACENLRVDPLIMGRKVRTVCLA